MRKIFKSYKMCENFSDSVSRVLTEVKLQKWQKGNLLLMNSEAPLVTNRPFTVVVEGNIGSGKTTFLQHFNKFSEEVEILAEPVDKWRNANGHNLLQMMYEDPHRWDIIITMLLVIMLLFRWSLAFQTYVQLTMVQNHTKVITKSIKLMERSLFSAKYCFVENLQKSGKMPLSEYKVLSSWFEFLLSSPQVDLGVDLIVYMRVSARVAL